MGNAVKVIILSAVCLASTTGMAHAYLEPGTGSMILNALLGVLAATASALALFWHRVKTFFGRLFGRGSDDGKSN